MWDASCVRVESSLWREKGLTGQTASERLEDAEGLGVNIPRKRRQLMSHLDGILEVVFSKYDNPRTANPQRQGWGRLIVNCVAVGDALLKSAELEAIELRLRALEEVSKNKSNI